MYRMFSQAAEAYHQLVHYNTDIFHLVGEEREDKTVILVSHRQSTMRITDKVYSVENGRMS